MAHQLRGYTLLEMIVSVGLFSLVMFVATGAYLTLIDLDRKARATNELTANLSFAVDSMARTLRTGYYFGCGTSGGQTGGTNDSDGCGQISFMDVNPNPDVEVTYKLLSDGTIGRCAFDTSSCSSDSNFISITDPRITIDEDIGLLFYVRGVGTSGVPENAQQPRVTFTIKGTMPSDSKGGTTPFVIQSGATQRLIEL